MSTENPLVADLSPALDRRSRRPRPITPVERPPMHPRLLLLLIAVVAGTLSPVGPAAAQERGGPEVLYAGAADAAAAWLVDRLDAEGEGWSATRHADLIVALAATNGSRTAAVRSLERMEDVVGPSIGSPGAWDHGAIAKVVLAAQTLGADVGTFGGHDLEALLRAAVVTTGPDTGRVGSAGPATQPLAIMALSRTPGGAPASTGAWLAAQQCPDGGFSGGPCDQADAAHTGLAASALHAVGRTADRDEALDWLEDHPVSDARSTGLAVQALRAAGRSTAVDAGAEHVYELQKTAGADAGAIAWQATVDGDLLLATTQGVLAWGAPTYAELAFPEIVGEPCPPAQGVTVVLDLAHFDDTIRVGCAPGPHASGTSAVRTAGFAIGWHPQYPGGGPGLGGAVCTLAGYPSAGYPECWFTGFWSYWHARPDAQWVFSNCGIDNRTPRQGTIEGWRYEPDVNNHLAAPPLVDARFPRVTLDAPEHLEPGETATLAVTVERTAPRVAPGAGAPPEPCFLPPSTGPEAHSPTITGPVPEGRVEIRVDGEPVGEPVAVGGGTASLTTVLPDGDHEVTAHFLGTATDLPSPSAAAAVLVAPPTTTTLTADPTTVGRGDGVALTATVAPAEGTGVVDEGAVQLRAGGEPLGAPVAVDATGTATLTTSFDALGTVDVTAHHLGSAAGLPSDSEAVTVTVEEGEVEKLVRDLYAAVLGRPPGAGDLDYWVGRFEAGTAPDRLAESLARTREGWSQVVRQHYRLALGREGEAGGVGYWTDVLQRTDAPDTLLTDLFASPEVFTARGGGTNPGFFTYLYDRVLDRAPDAGGLAYWVDRLDSWPGQASIGRKSAARALVFTGEGITRQVQAAHEAVCGVPATGAALAPLTARFKASHLNPSTLRAAIVIRGCPRG